MLPILTGQTELELPEARRGKPNAKNIDDHPWIFKDFEKIGYATQFAEEDPKTGMSKKKRYVYITFLWKS